jgi:hypothetical protein
VWVEGLRVDHANHILGVRLNVWTSIIVFVVAVGFLVVRRRDQPDPSPADRSSDDLGGASAEAPDAR